MSEFKSQISKMSGDQGAVLSRSQGRGRTGRSGRRKKRTKRGGRKRLMRGEEFPEVLEIKRLVKLADPEGDWEKVSERKGPLKITPEYLDRRLVERKSLREALKGLGLGFDRWSGFLYASTNITYNSAAGKYLQFFNVSATQPTTSVAAASEFSTLDQLYDECFIHSMQLEYIPRNSYNTSAYATGDGDFKNEGTCAAVVAALQHNAAAYSDANTAWNSMRSQRIHQVVDLAKHWVITWVNNERFAWDTPLGDQTTAASTQGWCQNTLVSTKYGGYMQIATPAATGAALGIGTLIEGATPGDISMKFHISMRARG